MWNYQKHATKWYWWQWILVIAAIGYLFWQLFPLLSNFFIMDDLAVLSLGPQLRANPLAWVKFTYFGWWRPIGLTSPGLLYVFFGFNTVPYHIFGLLIHFFATFILYKFARRLISTNGAVFAAFIYLTSPIFVNAFSFISIVCEDELAAAFCFLALLTALRTDTNARSAYQPYWKAGFALLAAAACKDNWIGLWPALVCLDFMQYKSGGFSQRVKRLAPLLLPVLIIFMRLIIVGPGGFVGNAQIYINAYFTPHNLMWGATLPFIPFSLVPKGGWEELLRISILFVFLIASIVLAAKQRRTMLILWIAFAGLLLASGSTSLFNDWWGWMHLPLLIGVSAIILALFGQIILDLLHVCSNWWLVLFILPVVYIIKEQTSIEGLKALAQKQGKMQSSSVTLLHDAARRLPAYSHLYVFGGLPPELVLNNILPRGYGYTMIIVKKSLGNNNKYPLEIDGDLEYIRTTLAEYANQPNSAYFVRGEEACLRNATGEIKAWLGGDDSKLPPELIKFAEAEQKQIIE